MTQTKKALIMSIFSMVLCMAMLMGTTFAWFTDTAGTAVNTVQAGNLKVELQMYDNGNWVSAEGKTLKFDNSDNIYWEPGSKHELPALRVVNKGNLAVKYRVGITGIDGDNELNKVIKWKIAKDKDGSSTAVDAVEFPEGHLAAVEDGSTVAGEAFTISAHMQDGIDDKYQGKKITRIGVTVYATQDAVEADSNGTDYDADATYPGRTIKVKTAAEFSEAVEYAWAGDTVQLTNDIKLDSAVTINSKIITIDLNGNPLSSTANNTIKLGNNAKLTIKGDVASSKITNSYRGSASATTIDLQGAGSALTVIGGTIESNAKDDLYSIAIGNSKKQACTVNIAGGTVAAPVGHVKSRAITASKGMILNISGGEIKGGLYGVDVYEGSKTIITGGNITANAIEGRRDEYGKRYAIHAKGTAHITIGSLKLDTVPQVQGIKFESNGPETELPTINLVKGDIASPIYSLEKSYNYNLFKLGIKADAPVTFADNTANYFLPDGLQMVKDGDKWKVIAK